MQTQPSDWSGLDTAGSIDQAARREAARLSTDYQLDGRVAMLLLKYLQRIAQLEQQVRLLQSSLAQPVSLPREGPTPWREPHA